MICYCAAGNMYVEWPCLATACPYYSRCEKDSQRTGPMLYNDKIKLYRNAIKAFGEKTQSMVAVEEMSELTKEISKHYRGKEDLNDLAEEVADVTIMLEQLRIMYDINSLVERHKADKLERLAKRLEALEPGDKKVFLTATQQKIIRTYAEESMSITNTAKATTYTINNIAYHLTKIYENTGLDPRNFYDLNKLLELC